MGPSVDFQKYLMDLGKFIFNEATVNKKALKQWKPVSRPIETPNYVREIVNTLENMYQFVLNENEVPKHANENSIESKLKINDSKIEKSQCTTSRLSNLQNIMESQFIDVFPERKMYREALQIPQDAKTFLYEYSGFTLPYHIEAFNILMLYGSHTSIIKFLMRHMQVIPALRYLYAQHQPSSVFIQHIYNPCLKQNNVDTIFNYMMAVDGTLLMWKYYIFALLKYLTDTRRYKELYNIHKATKDIHRAANVSLKIYAINATSYTELQDRKDMLRKADELNIEDCNFEDSWVKVGTEEAESVVLTLTKEEIKLVTVTINMQAAIVDFLVECENRGVNVYESIKKVNVFNIFIHFLFLKILF